LETYRIENLTFSYPKRKKPALTDISLTVKRGAFVVLCGPSGCGKTTLLRQLKPTATPTGIKFGDIYFNSAPLEALSQRDAASKIGFVMQSPENQIVTDKVWHELAFGLESLGQSTKEIRLRVAEMASFFGIQNWFHKPVTELSGGQKQLLALASIMAMQPDVLILDEPTSQLDPIAAGEFLAAVGKINRELGVTIVLTEHRLEEAFPLASHAIVMDKGQIIAEGTPGKAGLDLWRQSKDSGGMFLAMPAPMRIWAACQKSITSDETCPITVREGSAWLESKRELIPLPGGAGRKHEACLLLAHASRVAGRAGVVPAQLDDPNNPPAITLEDIWFKYEKNLPDILKGISFKSHYGEITAILGGNGTGKTTALSIIAGLNKPYMGKIHTSSRVYALPQNPQSLFTAKTVGEDLNEILSDIKLTNKEKSQKISHITKLCRLEGLLESHPYDLSGGEQQRAALAKVLLLNPKIVLLDEPTKGLDAEYKQIFAAILHKLASSGVAIVIVSHDIEFCAEHTHRCALFFDGTIITENTPREFFTGNSFYTTSTNRMTRHIIPGIITVRDAINALDGDMPPQPEEADINIDFTQTDEPHSPKPQENSKKTPAQSIKRKIVLSAFVLWLLGTVTLAGLNFDNLTAFIGGGNEAIAVATEGAGLYVGIMLALAIGIIGVTITLTINREETKPHKKLQRGKLSKRTIAAAAIILLAIPVTIYIGINIFDDRRFYFISMLIILQTMLPFALVFESRKPQARELVIIAVLCGIGVAGRGAFFMLPHFKPVIAMVIISGVAFGGEVGFLVGAMTGFVSNMFFGQGPWTPWQMFAFGIIGFLAGVLFHKGLLSRKPIPLAIFGGIATLIIYGGIMNPAGVIMFQPNPIPEMFLLAYLQGIPFDLIHGLATVTFIIIISRPMLEKLDRIKVKYGLVA